MIYVGSKYEGDFFVFNERTKDGECERRSETHNTRNVMTTTHTLAQL